MTGITTSPAICPTVCMSLWSSRRWEGMTRSMTGRTGALTSRSPRKSSCLPSMTGRRATIRQTTTIHIITLTQPSCWPIRQGRRTTCSASVRRTVPIRPIRMTGSSSSGRTGTMVISRSTSTAWTLTGCRHPLRHPTGITVTAAGTSPRKSMTP